MMIVNFSDLSSRLGYKKTNSLFVTLEKSFGITIIKKFSKEGLRQTSIRSVNLEEVVTVMNKRFEEDSFLDSQRPYMEYWGGLLTDLEDILEEMREAEEDL